MNSDEMSVYESTVESNITNPKSQTEASNASISESSSAFSVLLSVAEQMEPIPIPVIQKPFNRFPVSIADNEVGGFPKNYGYQVAAPASSFPVHFDHSLENGAGGYDATRRGPSKGYHVSLSSAVPPTKMSVSTNGISSPSSGIFYANTFIDPMNSHKKSDSQILGRNIMQNSKQMLKTFSKHSGYITKIPPPTAMETNSAINPSQQMVNINDHQNYLPYSNNTINIINNSNNNNTFTSNHDTRSNDTISANHTNDSMAPQDNHSSAEDMDDEDDPRRKRKRELSRASHARMRQQIDNKLSRVVSLLRIYREKTSKEGNISHQQEIA